MKKILILSLSLLSFSATAAELYSFADVKSAALSGKKVKFVIDFKKCANGSKFATEPANFFGVFTMGTAHATDNKISSSFNFFTLNSPGFINIPVTEYVYYVVSDDNQLTLTHQKLDARNYVALIPPVSVNCKLNEGVKAYA